MRGKQALVVATRVAQEMNEMFEREQVAMPFGGTRPDCIFDSEFALTATTKPRPMPGTNHSILVTFNLHVNYPSDSEKRKYLKSFLHTKDPFSRLFPADNMVIDRKQVHGEDAGLGLTIYLPLINPTHPTPSLDDIFTAAHKLLAASKENWMLQPFLASDRLHQLLEESRRDTLHLKLLSTKNN